MMRALATFAAILAIGHDAARFGLTVALLAYGRRKAPALFDEAEALASVHACLDDYDA